MWSEDPMSDPISDLKSSLIAELTCELREMPQMHLGDLSLVDGWCKTQLSSIDNEDGISLQNLLQCMVGLQPMRPSVGKEWLACNKCNISCIHISF